MTLPAMLLSEARANAGLSMRALAARADVAYSTVARIESGQVDPTVGMLSKLMDASGFQLQISSAQRTTGPELAALADAWRPTPRGDKIDWTRLRAFLDFIVRHPDLTAAATKHQPRPSGSPLLDNLLAGMAEKACDDADLRRPPWTARVPALGEPWITPGTPRTQEIAQATTPRQLAMRGVTLAATSLWREPASARL